MALNSIEFNEAIEEIQDLSALEAVLQHLYRDRNWRLHAREWSLVSSIITRSEAGLFCLSMPRFAARLTLADGGFINCRRLNTFANSAESGGTEWASISGSASPQIKPPTISNVIFQAQPKPTCVADCLLAPPKLMQEDYHFPQPHLQSAYGGVDDLSTNNVFLPYVQHVDFGGGMCAQAVCFMATAILLRHATNIYGLAEISALATSPHQTEVQLSNLDVLSLQRYFRGVELNTSEQAMIFPDLRFPLETASSHRYLGAALRGYLRSGMPVVFLTNTEKLANVRFGLVSPRSVYEANSIEVNEPFEEGADFNHAVLIVGFRGDCQDDGALEGANQYVFHDPATAPYLKLSVAEMLMVPSDSSDENVLGYSGVICPVTPAAVKLPLLCERNRSDAGEVDYSTGLFFIARFLDSAGRLSPQLIGEHSTNGRLLSRRLQSRCLPGTQWFVLCQAGKGQIPFLETLAPEIRQRLTNNLSVLLGSSMLKNHWVWLEVLDSAVWVWNAELLPPKLVLSPGAHNPIQLLRFLHFGVYLDSSTGEELSLFPESLHPVTS